MPWDCVMKGIRHENLTKQTWRYLLWWPVVNKRASESLLCWNVTKMHQERRAQQ